jgi:hypothetical protein
MPNPTPADTSRHKRCGFACRLRGEQAVDAAFAVNFITRKFPQYWQLQPDTTVMDLPCGVFWINDQEQPRNHSNRSDLIGYPVHWAAADRGIGPEDETPDDFLKLREVTADALMNQRLDLTIVPESHPVEWVPEKVLDEKLPAYEYLFSAMTFICWCKRARGLKG